MNQESTRTLAEGGLLGAGRRYSRSVAIVQRYRFLLRPKWIFGHVLVVTLVTTFILCGFWQLSRLHQRKAFNSLVRGNQSEAVVPVTALGLRPSQGTGHARADQGRRVTVTGTYLADRSMVITGQSIDGNPGVWVVTPVALDDGTLVLVNRGFLQDNGTLSAAPVQSAPPPGRVTITGTVQPTETPSVFQRRDPEQLRTSYQRIDVDRIRGALARPTLPLWILSDGHQVPKDPGLAMQTVPPPALTNGPHLGYAVQWFAFTLVGLIGYPLLIRKKAGDLERGPDHDEIIDETEPAVDASEPGSSNGALTSAR